jgi:CDP-paratose 2-epimerase
MRIIIVTGSAGLIGSEAVRRFARAGARVVGIDSDMRAQFFGAEASTKRTRDDLVANVRGYDHHDLDIRNASAVAELFKRYRGKIHAIVHTASQPSHDWAARDPQVYFTLNANGTLNLLEAARTFAPEAPFMFTSTNKVYGDTPNRLPLQELPTRWEIEPGHEYEPGISETMSIDYSKHSLFGASKAAADLLVQGIWTLFWIANRFFSRWLPHRACARGYGAAWFSFLPDDLYGERQALPRVRIQGQAGP